MNFNCPSCSVQLMAEPQMSGQSVKCPSCNSKIEIPSFSEESLALANSRDHDGSAAGRAPTRQVWTEQDPTNPNSTLSVGIAFGVTILWFVFIYFFQAPAGKVSSEFTTSEVLANLFYKHFTVSFANTLFFCWGAAICYLKLLKLKHQRRAMLLDVLPRSLGNEISAQNVGAFIDHVYGLPVNLRDSLMVNRIRKALEFFEVRQNVADVSSLMASQSAIDGSRIMGSYIMVRAFLWAIPLLGFIGTVIGLSHAISGMSFSNVEDVGKIVGSINNVTSGLGTAFDATLLGLVFAVVLNFPLNSLAKHEEEALNDIDAYCNEVLLPRLDDGAASKQALEAPQTRDIGVVAHAMVQAITASQSEFLTDLNALSAQMLDHAHKLENRNEQYQQAALQHLAQQMELLDSKAQEHLETIRKHQDAAMQTFGQSLTRFEQSSTSLHQSMKDGHASALARFSEQLTSVGKEAAQELSASLQTTQKAVSSFAELVQKVESSAREHHKTAQNSHEESFKQFADKLTSQTSSLEKALTAQTSTVEKALTAQTSTVEKALTASIDLTQKSLADLAQRAFAGISEQVQKTESAARDHQSALTRSQENALSEFTTKMAAQGTALEKTLAGSMELTQRTISGLESGIRNLNGVLLELGAKQVVIQQVKKKSWFSRD